MNVGKNKKIHNSNNYLWLRKTGQFWKLKIFFILISIGIVTLFMFIWFGNHSEYENLYIVCGFIFIGIGTASFSWLIFSIRCPSCNKKPVYHILSNEEVSIWLSKLNSLDACPYCHYTG